jgi:GNAT superfamily N-acetyltransferase
VNVRPATVDDAGTIHAAVTASFEAYRSFAPAGWNPPEETVARERELLARADYHAWIAEDGGGYAGHAAWWPASETFRPTGDPRLAHLRHLFLAPAHWGSGLAADLLARVVADARAAGFTRMRLGTPQGQARARRFYEREGWTWDGAVLEDTPFGLPMVEYFRPLL